MAPRLRSVWMPLVLLGGFVSTGCGLEGDPLRVGAQAQDFTVVSTSDASKSVALKDFKGQVVVLDFWATWCAPCRETLPHVQKLWDDNKDKGVQVMAISEEDSATVNDFQNQNKFDFPCYTDGSNVANSAFGVSGYPTTVVIGKDGRVVYSAVGLDANTESEIDAAVATALK